MITTTQIAADVDRGLEIVRQMDEMKGELKAIEARLAAAALAGPTEPLVDDEREGRRYLAQGSAARLAVILESDQIVGSFAADGTLHSELCRLCGGGERLRPLYRLVAKFERVPKDGKAFRRAATEHWAPDEAARIISAAISRDKDGVPKSRVVVAWEQAK